MSTSQNTERKKDKIVKEKKRQITLAQLSRNIASFNCGCGHLCLAKCAGSNKSIDESASLLAGYIDHWRSMSKREHKEQFMKQVEQCTSG
jgi:hypothetical protein